MLGLRVSFGLCALVFSARAFAGEANKLPAQSPYLQVIAEMSPVQDQGDRNTCTTFSAAAHLEHLLFKQGIAPRGIKLSEQWLQILNMSQNSTEESTAIRTLSSASSKGLLLQAEMPYSKENWDLQNLAPGQSMVESAIAKSTCGHLENEFAKTQCLWAHFDVTGFLSPDPFLSSALDRAKSNFPQVMSGKAGYLDFDQAKQALARGETVVMDIDFYFGAWNHPAAKKLRIPRSETLWQQGVVGYPEEGSMDDRSLQKPSGHSVLIVGYDDKKIIRVRHQMLNGRPVQKTYRGVFIIRNSLGTNRFGSEFKIGKQKFSGYGMITQDYARDYGSFVQFKLAQ